jgi:hypothetical protein
VQDSGKAQGKKCSSLGGDLWPHAPNEKMYCLHVLMFKRWISSFKKLERRNAGFI